jgi:two-component system cell cycle sensor histidine kinase/response regulator CckA
MNTLHPTILCVDDEPANLKLLENILVPRGYTVVSAAGGHDALSLIRSQSIDLVLLDVIMPGMDGFEVCRLIKQDPRFRNTPVIMITALTAKQDRIRGIEAGAEEFLSKPFDQGEALARVKILLEMKELHDARDRTESQREAAITALRESHSKLESQVRERTAQLASANEKLQADILQLKRADEILLLRDRAIESMIHGLCITDPAQPDNPIIYANESFLRITGRDRQDVMGRNCRFLQGPETSPEAIEQVRSAIREGKSCWVELLNYRRDGTSFWNSLSISAIRDADGRVEHFVGVLTDISPLKLMEQQFHRAQKMEAVGQLAGGVAHDFNNLLTIISGYSELLLGMLPPDDSSREAIKAISEAGERAAGLTRQLLSFSRHAVMEMKVLDLNQVVRETEKLLRRMIGEDLVLTTVLDPNVSRIKADPGHIGQVLMNLAVNARDALPHGGKLTIETSDVILDETYAAGHLDCKPGPYVMLAVSDNGCGMPPEVQAHIFEPFFTTKGQGSGTGLGLSTVYGIVRQSGGTINLYSESGYGTSFKIYLPAVNEQLDPSADGPRAADARGGTETILLVEDEDAVRAIALLALRTHGYTVLQAESGKNALRIFQQHEGRIDLIVTDVIMPGMNGRELAEELCLRYSGLKVLYMSGYTGDSAILNGVLREKVAFLQKPYTPLSLARKVRQVLDSPC